MNPIKELISQWGQWDLNPSIKWDQLLSRSCYNIHFLKNLHIFHFTIETPDIKENCYDITANEKLLYI